MRRRKLLVSLLLCLGFVGCGTSPDVGSQLSQDSAEQQVERRKLGATDILDAIAKGKPEQPVKFDQGVTAADIEVALEELGKKVRPKANDNTKLEVDAEFEKSLNASQKNALNKMKNDFENKVKDGKLKLSKKADGSLQVEEVGEKTKNEGKGKDELNPNSGDDEEIQIRHAVGNGNWSWSYTSHWWGRKLYVNHNFLWYLCRYTSWLLDVSGLPSWAKTVLRLLLCAPHSADGGADGSTVYVTWALVFWYSP